MNKAKFNIAVTFGLYPTLDMLGGGETTQTEW